MTATPLTPETASTQPFELPGQPGFTPPPSRTEAGGAPNMVAPGQEDLLQEFLREQGLEQGQPPAEPPSEPQGKQSELLLGKFKSTEDLAKAYKELERKLGQRAQQAAQQAPITYSRELGVQEFGEALAERFEDAGFNPLALEARIAQGEVTLEDAAKELAEAGGISAKAAAALLGSRVETQAPGWSDTDVSEVMQLVGGEEQFQAISQWALDNLGDDQLRPYNEAVAAGDRAAVEMGLRWLVAEARARHFQAQASDLVEPDLAQGRAPGGGAVFFNGAQVREAMNRLNTRGQRLYDVDPAYRQKVEEMVARSPGL